jgi:hypothetical protein
VKVLAVVQEVAAGSEGIGVGDPPSVIYHPPITLLSPEYVNVTGSADAVTIATANNTKIERKVVRVNFLILFTLSSNG